ncbi:MAG TPA: response regulator [Polyangia bacterium]|jgi:CheY-like chemotaxis protein|nr:response regulator [Polyangia bacterium]
MGNSGQSSCVCLVEDDPDIRGVIREFIYREGFGVVCASNGEEALAALRSGTRPRLILLDLIMPVMNGWDFLRERAKDADLANVPVVLLSGDGEVEKHAESYAVAGCLRKPIDMESLIETVRRYC